MSKHIYNTIIFTVLVYFGFLSKAVAQQPNFVIIMLDDQGWTGSSVQMDADLSTSKSDYYVTANLETLASSGMVFSRGYAPAPKCAPSRNSILTGMSTARNSFTSTDNNIAEGKVLIEATTETIISVTITGVKPIHRRIRRISIPQMPFPKMGGSIIQPCIF